MIGVLTMNTFLLLLWADIKQQFRNKQAMFWRFVFPIIFIIVFGLFNLDSFATSKMVVVDYAKTDISQKIIDGFSKVDFIKIDKQDNLDEAKNKLKKSDIDFIIVMPEKIKDIKTDVKPTVSIDPITRQPKIEMPTAPDPITMDVYYNESNVAANQLVLNVLSQITTQINATAGGAPKLFDLHSQALTNKKIRYIDFLMPGVIAMSIMNAAVIGIAVYITEYREKKILKRVLATPLDRKTFIASQVVSKLLISFIEAIIVIAVAKLLYQVNIYGSYWLIAMWVVLESLVFLNLGFIIASFSKTSSAAESLSQIITLPLMFLSGVFFSTETLPKTVRTVVDNLPLSPIIESLRKVILNGDSISATSHQLYIVGAWIVGLFIVAILRFRLIRD